MKQIIRHAFVSFTDGAEVATRAHAMACAAMQSYALMHSGMPLASVFFGLKHHRIQLLQ